GVFLVIERVGLANRLSALPAAVRHAYLLVVVMVSWVFFRADTLPHAVSMLGSMFGFGGTVPAAYAPAWYLNHEVVIALVAGIIGATPIVPHVTEWSRAFTGSSQRRLAWAPSVAGVVALVVL